MPKSPAFQFYPKDWLSSRKARRMTPEQRGGYADLLAQEWLDDDCSLPDNDEDLAFLSGLNERWSECSKLIRSCFFKKGKKLFNKRLLEEKEKQEAFRLQCSKAGRKSGEARRNKELEAKVGSTGVEGGCNSSSLSLSLSSSLSSTASTKKKTTKDKDSVRFKKPSLEEVQQYITEKGYDIDAETFIAHYESNGWKVGRNNMKSWKSACVTWSKSDKKDEGVDW